MFKLKNIFCIIVTAALLLTATSCTEDKPDDSDFSYETVAPSDSNGPSLYNGFSYVTYADSHIRISDYKGSSSKAVIPSVINGLPVTEIAEKACYENHTIKTLEIPDSVTTIGAGAFYGCSSLTEVSVGSGVTTIGDNAFAGTPYIVGNKTEFLIVGDGILLDHDGAGPVVTVPEGVKKIVGAFQNNALITEVILPDSLTEIGGYSFSSCTQLTTVTIPETVTRIGDWAFAKCISLKEIAIPNSVTSIGERCFLYCTSAERLTISEKISIIPVSAFQSCSSLKEAALPSSVATVSDNAFLRCSSLEKITVPDSVKVLGQMAFLNCSPQLTVICSDGSAAAQYCENENIAHSEQ